MKGLALLIAKKRKGASPEEGSSHLRDLEMPAEDLIDAVKTGDARRVARALKDVYEICSGSEPDAENDHSYEDDAEEDEGE